MKVGGASLDLELYKKLYLIRASENKIIEEYPLDEMKTPMHMSVGEEAIAVGVCHALKGDDQVFCSWRSHAVYLAKTQNTDNFFAEIYGRDTALLKGKGGSMHLCDPEKGFMGSSGIVASGIPVAVGAAFANKIKGNDKVVAVFFGDGATEEGVFWESLNLACLKELPIIFVCEDNSLAVHTSKEERQGYKDLSDIIPGFNHLLSYDVDTMDERVIHEIFKICSFRSGFPKFIRARYHRHLEHVGINTDYHEEYRAKEGAEFWDKKDPVFLQRKILLSLEYKEEDIVVLEMEIQSQIDQSIHKAKMSPFCLPEELLKGVWS
jgi:TPP-dependent pyruvate/acetoin dehydrogenase alpha subunit